MKIGDTVIVRGTIKGGIIVSERLVPAGQTGRGNVGDVKYFTVLLADGTTMEYEHLELRKLFP